MCKLIFAPTKLKTMDDVPVIFCCLRLQPSQNGVCNSTEACHRKLSHPFSQLARPRWPIGGGGEADALQSACQIQTWPWLFLLSTIQSCGVELGNMWPILYGLVLFYPPPLFFSLIFRSQRDSVFQAEARSLLSTCSICNWKHTNGLAGESSMPVGLLRRPVHSDPLIPQRGVGERDTHTDRERGI